MEEFIMEDYYRNIYQIAMRDNEQMKRELEEYKTLTTMLQDIIKSQNIRINNLEHDIVVLELDLEEKRIKSEKEKN